MIANKILGYLLLSAGILIMTFSLWQSYQIFSGKVLPPAVFSAPSPAPAGAVFGQGYQQQFNDAVRQQLSNMLPADQISKLLNLISWSMLAGILLWGGGQVAGIGSKLLR